MTGQGEKNLLQMDRQQLQKSEGVKEWHAISPCLKRVNVRAILKSNNRLAYVKQLYTQNDS